MLVDTGSQLSVLNAAWVQRNKKYFKNTAILPVNNLNITTATNKKERVKQQAYVTLTYKNLELEHPMIIMHKLIYDGILGIDILNTINAKININDNTIVCNYKNVQYELNMNSEEEECKVSETPITLYKPQIQYGPCLLYTSRCV